MSEGTKRKVRRDSGLVMATERDQYCIAWIAEQYAARNDQIQRLLSRFPDEKRPFKGELIAETTVRDQIARWRRAGWIEYKRVLAGESGYAWVTQKGLKLVDLDDIYKAHMPASVRLNHIYAVAQVRLGIDQKYMWESERRYRSELESEKAKDLGPIPDGIITTKNGRIAIEVEISEKHPAEMKSKLERLTEHFRLNIGPKAISSIWFYVSSEKIKSLVERVRDTLEQKQRSRIAVVQSDVIIAKRTH